MVLMEISGILIFNSIMGYGTKNVSGNILHLLNENYQMFFGNSDVFNSSNLPTRQIDVPQQNNSTDCGLYMLQFVESFFKNPIENYEEPCSLKNWFGGEDISLKRAKIKQLIKQMAVRYRLRK
ncbi:sentrin-specific protease 7-like [Copidosoma floridanum]|uniref:sentrin-specific protease 7-like n=1 Tax=Copidosoma floridanum TaxID=29053 RepID=UPI0006C9D0E3|nr:sentrin-specific protease 7-like [Copidosoma floridanum]